LKKVMEKAYLNFGIVDVAFCLRSSSNM
jgi:hypothetical protein